MAFPSNMQLGLDHLALNSSAWANKGPSETATLEAGCSTALYINSSFSDESTLFYIIPDINRRTVAGVRELLTEYCSSFFISPLKFGKLDSNKMSLPSVQ